MSEPFRELRGEIERAQAGAAGPAEREQALTVFVEEIGALIDLTEGKEPRAEISSAGGARAQKHIEQLLGRESAERSRGLDRAERDLRLLAGITATYRNDARLQAGGAGD